jgi:hypothetical protein
MKQLPKVELQRGRMGHWGEGREKWGTHLSTSVAALCVPLSELIRDAPGSALGSGRRLVVGHLSNNRIG